MANLIRAMEPAQIAEIEGRGSTDLVLDGRSYTVELADIEIVSEDIEGWLVAAQSGTTVALDTEIDEALRNEGMAREFVNRIQTLRKESGFDVTDRIAVQYDAPEAIHAAITAMRDYICDETLCTELRYEAGLDGTPLDIDDAPVQAAIRKV